MALNLDAVNVTGSRAGVILIAAVRSGTRRPSPTWRLISRDFYPCLAAFLGSAFILFVTCVLSLSPFVRYHFGQIPSKSTIGIFTAGTIVFFPAYYWSFFRVSFILIPANCFNQSIGHL